MIFTPTGYTTKQDTKEILQDVATGLDQYRNYWWRIRQNAGSYSLRLIPATQDNSAFETVTANNGTTYYKVNILECWRRNNGNENDGEYFDERTIKVSSNITISSSGIISLVNPSSYNISGENFNESTYDSILQGKYATGFASNPDTIYKISSNATIYGFNSSITVSGENTVYTDYCYEMTSIGSTYVQIAVSDYSSNASDYSYVSSEDENFYPHSGTQNNVDYEYIGKISDVALKAEPFSAKTVNITSANWNSKKYTINIPHKRYLLSIYAATDNKTHGGIFVFVDNQKAYGISYDTYYSNYSQKNDCDIISGADKIIFTITMNLVSNGFELSHTYSDATPTATVSYIPI